MKHLLETLDKALLYALPICYFALIFSIEKVAYPFLIFTVVTGFMCYFIYRYVKYWRMIYYWDELVCIYSWTSNLDNVKGDKAIIDDTTKRLEMRLSNILFRKINLSEYIDDKLLLFTMEEKLKEQSII